MGGVDVDSWGGRACVGAGSTWEICALLLGFSVNLKLL